MNARDDTAAGERVRAEGSPLEGLTWRLDLAYEGTAYRGWARQPGQRTVEGLLGEALASVLREPVRLSVAGRTDAGVHAWAQVASFGCARRDLRPDQVRLSLNALLPADIAVTAVSPAPPGFVARRAASRTYRYRLWLSPVKPVRDRAYVWNVRGAVDTGLLEKAAALLPGRRDFSALTPSAHLYHNCVREVLSAGWRVAAADDGLPGRAEWVFTISAGSFLHNMVRVAVGSMVDVAQERMTLEEFSERLAAGERRRMGQTAPACGLALVAVAY
ncbi:MAG: tRNA pseudouridine(38-40) synthase TruA [Actinobacteria bacterium]|nr:tRNA pseudouridine(38-40) synthase TruA [Actinomycetota bacterium]